MSKQQNNHDKPYMLDDDPFDTTKFLRSHSITERTWQPLAVLCGAGAIAGFEKLGWAGVIGILLTGVTLLIIILLTLSFIYLSLVKNIDIVRKNCNPLRTC